MSKFWFFSAFIIFIGLLLAVSASIISEDINFKDLETECREDRGEHHQVSVRDSRLEFEGYFPLKSTSADLSYDYRATDDRIVLNVKHRDGEAPEDFERECYATGVYEAETKPYEGRYTVVTKIDGEQVDKRVINFG
jgi:hypothetical protein